MEGILLSLDREKMKGRVDTRTEEPTAEEIPEAQEGSEGQQILEMCRKFSEEFGPRLGLALRFNPFSLDDARINNLCDFTRGRYADLVLNNVPFFTAGRYRYGGVPYDPTYTVTLDKLYYDMRKRYFSDCDVYFRVNWTELEHDFRVPIGKDPDGHPHKRTKRFQVQPLNGVWRASFAALTEKIESGTATLAGRSQPHFDEKRIFFYLLNLNDPEVFERLL